MGCNISSMMSHISTDDHQSHYIHNHKEVHTIDTSLFITTGLLGVGGFGRVFAGTCIRNSRWYAIKEIKKTEVMKHKCGLSMIFGELDAMRRVEHSFIINLNFAFQDRRRCFFVLDMKTGGDLRYYLRKRYLFEERDVAFYIACISSALEHIHSQNMIHRDIKPENIILDERGYPYITDFGVAHVQPEENWDGTLTSTLASGTKQYLAPEVFTKSHIHGPEVDYWSLGVLAYELLYGKRPFEKHCPIQFINYLEKGLSAKRKRTKELQMKELCGGNSDRSYDSPSRNSMGVLTGAGSPCQSFDFPPSPSTRYGTGYREAFTKEKISPVKPKAFPSLNLRSGNSTEATTMDRDNSIGYCSSVGVSQPSPLNTDSRRSPHPFSSSTNELSVSTEFNNHRQPSFSDSHNQKNSHHALPPPESPTRDMMKLPEIKYSRCSTPPAGIFKKDNNQMVHPIACRPQHQSDARSDCTDPADSPSNSEKEKSSTHSADENEQTFRRAVPGDHWLVDEGVLPPNLIAPVPPVNPWLGLLTQECQEVLAGLFEVRPSHRLGARNSDKLRKNRWFELYQIGNWEELKYKTYQPRFQPGKRFIKETIEKINDLSNAKFLGDDEVASDDSVHACDLQQELSPEEDEMFNEFFFVTPQYRDLFPMAPSEKYFARYQAK